MAKLSEIAFYLLLVFLVNACSPDREVVQILQGPAGADGQSHYCTVSQAEGGALVTCDDGTEAFVANGAQGPQGETGPTGEASEASIATLTDYSGNSCTKIAGTNSYVKKSGSNYKLYTSSICHSSSAYAEVSEGEAYWVSSTAVAIHSPAALRVIEFGGN